MSKRRSLTLRPSVSGPSPSALKHMSVQLGPYGAGSSAGRVERRTVVRTVRVDWLRHGATRAQVRLILLKDAQEDRHVLGCPNDAGCPECPEYNPAVARKFYGSFLANW